ncbi:MAG: hypothetical protein AAF205_06065, partial [Pseudomonadota bacterium]
MRRTVTAAALAILVTLPAAAQTPVLPAPGQADFADLTLNARTILSARIDKTKRVKEKRAPGLAPGFGRLLVRANVESVVAAPSAVPGRIEYLVDLPLDARGKVPEIEERKVLLFLDREHAPGEFVLSHKYGQQMWSVERETVAKRFAAERVDPAMLALKPERILSAFNVPGTLPGESESQIFIETESGNPMSLVILNRPDQEPRYAIATSDIIDASAAPPEAGSLAATLLACDLPETLPDTVLEERPAEMADALT